MDNANTKYLIFIILIAISNLLLLFYFKYSQNGLAIEEFKLLKIGNLINLFFSILLIISCLLLYTKDSNNFKMLLFLSIVYFFPLIMLLILKFNDVHYSQTYLLGYPLKKIVPLLLLLVNQIIQLYLIVFTFLLYFKNGKLLYVTAALYVLGVIILLVGISFASTFIIKEKQIGKTKPYDIGIVFGAAVWSGNKPSPIFEGRIEKGFELFKKGIIKKIQLTGGNAPGEVSEARAAINYLKKNKHINTNNILIEEKTTTTNEQIKYIKEKLVSKNSETKIIFISDNFHLKRILEMADFFNLHAVGIASDYRLSLKKSLYYRFRDSVGLLLFWIFGV